jgi:hypothetical protein
MDDKTNALSWLKEVSAATNAAAASGGNPITQAQQKEQALAWLGDVSRNYTPPVKTYANEYEFKIAQADEKLATLPEQTSKLTTDYESRKADLTRKHDSAVAAYNAVNNQMSQGILSMESGLKKLSAYDKEVTKYQVGLTSAEKEYKDAVAALENQRKVLEDSKVYYRNLQKVFSLSEADMQSLKDYAVAVAGKASVDSDKGYFALKNKGLSHDDIYAMAETWNRYQNALEAQQEESDAKAYAKEHPVLGTIGSWGAQFVGSIPGSVEALAQGIKHGVGLSGYHVADPNADGFDMTRWAGNVQGQVVKDIEGENPNGWQKLGSYAYQALNSAVNSGLTIGAGLLTGGGSVVPSALFFTSAAQSDFLTRTQAGYSTDEAFLSGIVSGALELLTEKYSVDNLLNMKKPANWKQLLKSAAIQGGVEVTEEEANFVAGLMADAVIHGSDSELNRRIRELQDTEGMTQAEAKAQAFTELAQQAADTAITSFLSGSMMAGVNGSAQKLSSDVAAKKDQQAQGGENLQQPQTPVAGKSPAVSTPVALPNAIATDGTSDTQSNLNTNAVSKPLNSYPVEKQNMILSYVKSVDEKIKSFVQRVKSGDLSFKRQKISDVNARAATDIGNLLGIDVSGYTHNINTYGVQHLLNRHGEKGAQDKTMSLEDDIARVGWVLENYDSVELLTKDGQQVYSSEFKDKNGQGVPQIRFIKKIDGSYYVVEAACENEYKKLWVQSAYLTKNEDVTQVSAEGQSTNHKTYAQSELASPSSNNNIAQGVPGVNHNESVGAADANFTGKQAYYDLLTDDNVKPGSPGDVRNVEVPKIDGYGRKVSGFADNAVGAEVTTDEMAGAIEELIGEGALGFDVKSDKSLFDDAAKDIKKSMAGSRRAVTTAAMKGKATDADIAKALLLYNIYNQKGKIDDASEIMVDLATMANDAGRKLRLFGLLRKMTPEGQAAVIQKTVERAVKRLNEGRSDKNQADVTIPQELMDAYTDAARRDSYEHSEESEQAKVEAEQAIYKAAAAQIQASPMEKLNAWRYMAMLGNAKTQLRNFAGNALFRPLVSIKRAVGAAIESVTLEQKDRTKAVLGRGEDAKALVSWAQEDASSKTAEELLSYCAQTGDAARNAIDENRQIFETKWLESVREFVKKVPEGADMLFKKREYTLSLASFLKARGYTAADIQAGKVSQDALNEGRAYAAQEALKATFNDHNFLSDGLAKMRYKGNHWAGQLFNMLGEGVMPFRRTPANIVVRGMEYSPVGLLRGIGNAAFNVRSGKVSAATAIDQIAGGLTGMGMMALGWALASGVFGIRLRGTVDEEEKLSGHQSYALEIGDQSYDISWLAPANIPLLVGANLCENSADGENWLLSLADSTVTALEPMLELSCLSSLNDLIRSAQYAEDGEWLYALAANGATSYLNQFIPTILGQTEQAFEGEKKSVYSNADTALERNVEKTIGRITQKIPGIDLFQAEKVDKWGRTQEQNPVEQVFNAFINPSKVTTVEETEADMELERLRNAVPDENVYPGSFRKEISYTDSNGKTQKKELTAEEYATLAKAQGQQSRELVEEIISMDDYKGLSDAEKAKVIRGIYEYSAAVSKSAVIEGYSEEPPDITNRAKGMSIAEAIIRQTVVGTTKMYTDLPLKQAVYIKGVFDLLEKEKKADGTEYASVRTVQKVEALAGSNLSEKQQEDVMDDILDDGAYEKYAKILAAGYDTDDYAAAYRLYQDTEKSKYASKKDTIINAFVKELGITRNAAKTLYDIYAGKDD